MISNYSSEQLDEIAMLMKLVEFRAEANFCGSQSAGELNFLYDLAVDNLGIGEKIDRYSNGSVLIDAIRNKLSILERKENPFKS